MRTTFVRTLVIAGVAVLALAACGSSSKSSSSSDTTVPATTAPTTAAAGGTPAVELTTATVKDFGSQKILADAKGNTLYIWDKDTTPGKASCTGACAEAWPPLYVTGTPAVGAGLTASDFTTVTGPNGNKQLAVNGKPLYLWKVDTAAGQTTGQGVNGFYVVNAKGEKLDKD